MRTVLALLFLVAGVLGSAKDVEKSDSQVVNAALLTFFEKAEWQTFEWQEGDFVVIRPEKKLVGEKPEDFMSVLKEIVHDSKEEPVVKALLEKNKASATRGKFELTDLDLDARILVDSLEARSAKDGMVRNKEGTFGTIRVAGRLSPPLYSSDGQSAILQLRGVIWSFGRHWADVAFVLQKVDDKWKVVFVQPYYYV